VRPGLDHDAVTGTVVPLHVRPLDADGLDAEEERVLGAVDAGSQR
jgi:hypothetical protein